MAGRILIVDDVATNRLVLKVKLAAACYDTLQAETGAQALDIARSDVPDLILLDVMLPDIDGVDVCTALKADPATRDIPVIMVTAYNDFAARMAALAAGADDFLSKPLDDLTLLARLRSLLRARETADELRLRDTTCRELGFAEAAAGFEMPGSVGIVSASHDAAVARCAALAALLPDRICPLTRTDALSDPVDAGKPQSGCDVFVISADLDGAGDGLRLMSEIRSRPATRHAAICMVVPREAREAAAMALDLGANDLVTEDVDPQELALRLRTLLRRKRQSDQLRATLNDGLRLAVTDPLTGLYNRRYALPHLGRIHDRACETGRFYAVMLLDLDRFKEVNDTLGHAAGDAVLAEVAARLRGNLRAVDLVARIGGEEFLVAMPDAALAESRIAAERLRRVIGASPVVLAGDKGTVAVTVSIGLAMGDPATDIEALMDRADAALRASKAEGRNLVTICRDAA